MSDPRDVCFRVLYTRHLTKKLKTYCDGYVRVRNGRRGELYDEEGRSLSATRFKTTITAESEGIESFKGFLVNCDAECSVGEIPKGAKRDSIQRPPRRASPPRPFPKVDIPPRAGPKKRRGARENTDPVKKTRSHDASTDKPRSDAEVLDLSEKPTAERSSKSVSIVVRSKPFKCPSLKLDGANDRVESDGFDLRFHLFGKKAERKIAIPEAFADTQRYRQIWKAALHEEMQLRLEALAMKLRLTLKALEENQKQDPATNASAVPAATHTATWLKKNGIQFHDDCKIQVYKKESRDDDVYFIQIANLTEEAKKSARWVPLLRPPVGGPVFRRHDLWVVSSDPMFLYQRGSRDRRVVDRRRGPWISVFGSQWHGVTREGKIQLELLSKQRPWQSSDHVYVLHGPSVGLEMTVWEALTHTDRIDESLMAALITKQIPSEKADLRDGWVFERRIVLTEAIDELTGVEDVIERFRLNSDQAAAVRCVSRWLPAEDGDSEARLGPSPPICLIHGPFGTGKSSLLVAIIHLLTASHHEGSGMRVLMCAHTNKAVDRIMEGLLKSGFTDFIRVGLLDKISRHVLPQALYHASETNDANNTATELKRQLQNCQSPKGRTILRQEIEEVEQGKVHKRREKLSTASVVGVTCCSANSAFLQGLTFDVVMLDEACQIIEPLSLLPLIKTEAKFLIAAGDPCQLPAVVAQPAEVASGGKGLTQALFSRLQTLGHSPYLLRTQYRCHPELSRVPNRFFYDGKLRDGCNSEDRRALIPGWSALSHVQVTGTAMKHDHSHSYYNKPEALAVAKVVKNALRHGLPDEQIGVICFFRAQVKLISSLLLEKSETIQVATVDSFQGMEKDVIVLSMSVDVAGTFASDPHRLNVALTRAKHHLVIVGDRSVLTSISPCVENLIQNAADLTL